MKIQRLPLKKPARLAVLTLAMIGLFFGLVAVPVLSVKAADTTSTAVNIKTIENFRVVSARTVKANTLYRSSDLNKMSAADNAKLAKLLGKKGLIIDVRTAAVRKSIPDKAVPGVKNINIPIEGLTDQKPMVTDATRRAQVGKVLKAAANNSGPVLIHCTAGKDRTGWVVAMIMYSTGASDKEVMAEYMKSKAAYPNAVAVKTEWMNNGLKAARANYGSIGGYLKKGTGLTDNDIKKLQTKFKATKANPGSTGTTPTPTTGNGTSAGLTKAQCTAKHRVWNSTTNKCTDKCVTGYYVSATNPTTHVPTCSPQRGGGTTGGTSGGTSGGQSTTASATKFRIATYNILGSNHVADGTRVGSCGGGGCVKERANNAMNAIQGKTGNAAFDVVGLQELRNDQYKIFNAGLKGYAHSTIADSSSQTIYWDKDRFTIVKSGGVKYPYFGNSTDTAPWVLLKDKRSGAKFYVINHHAASKGNANDTSPASKREGALKRERTAHIIADWADKTYASSKLPIFVLGDLNSTTGFRSNGQDSIYNGNRSRLPYCILTNSGLLHFSFDSNANRMGVCPLNAPKAGSFSIDHVLVSKDVRVIKTGTMSVPKASDHRPAYADVVIGKGAVTGGGGGSSDSVAPTVKLVTPADEITINKFINLSAKATDNNRVAKVEFYRGNTRIVTDTKTPFIKRWNTSKLPNGDYKVYAVAYDAAGNKRTSSKVTVHVDHSFVQTYPQIKITDGTKKITVGLVGSCTANTKGSRATTPKALAGKEVVAGITFSAGCKNKGAGVGVEINLGATYETDTLQVFKQNGSKLTDITSSTTAVDMNVKGKTYTYVTYSLVDGGSFDTDGKKNAKVADPLFVVRQKSVDDTTNQNGGTTTTNNPDGSVTVTTSDGNSVTTAADGTVIEKGGVLPNTGTSGKLLFVALLAAVAAIVFARVRKHRAMTLSTTGGVADSNYTLADVVQSQQNDANMVSSKKR